METTKMKSYLIKKKGDIIMVGIEAEGLILFYTCSSTQLIIDELLDKSFIRYWKKHKDQIEIYEDDVIMYYLTKDHITDKQSKLLCEYFSYYNSQRSIDDDLTVLAIEHNAVNTIVKKLKEHINSYAEQYLLSDIIDYLKAGVYYE